MNRHVSLLWLCVYLVIFVFIEYEFEKCCLSFLSLFRSYFIASTYVVSFSFFIFLLCVYPTLSLSLVSIHFRMYCVLLFNT